MVVGDGLNKQRGSVWIGRGGGSYTVDIPFGMLLRGTKRQRI